MLNTSNQDTDPCICLDLPQTHPQVCITFLLYDSCAQRQKLSRLAPTHQNEMMHFVQIHQIEHRLDFMKNLL